MENKGRSYTGYTAMTYSWNAKKAGEANARRVGMRWGADEEEEERSGRYNSL